MISINNGSSAWSAAILIRESRIEPAEIARFLRLSAPAFHRCLERDRFTRNQRSKLVRLATILARAERILGSRAHAIRWLISANRALGFSAPIGLLETKLGLERVHHTLLRIESGFFA